MQQRPQSARAQQRARPESSWVRRRGAAAGIQLGVQRPAGQPQAALLAGGARGQGGANRGGRHHGRVAAAALPVHRRRGIHASGEDDLLPGKESLGPCRVLGLLAEPATSAQPVAQYEPQGTLAAVMAPSTRGRPCGLHER